MSSTLSLGSPHEVDPNDWIEELEGQLAIDVYHTNDSIIVKAPIAGVRQEDLEITITDESITIKGERHDNQTDPREGYYIQECYWGSFSRTYQFPATVDSDGATARLVDGILTITIPKSAKTKTRTLSVHAE